MDITNLDGASGQEDAGWKNEPNLIEELAAEVGGVYDGWVDPVATPNRWPVAVEAVTDMLAILRKRGLLTIQALEILERDRRLTPLPR